MDTSASGDLSRVSDDRETRITAGVGDSVRAEVGSDTVIGVGEAAIGVGMGIGCDVGVGTTGLPASEFVEVGAGGTLVGGGGAGTWVGVGVGFSKGALSDVDVWIDVDAGVFVGSTIAGAVILSSAIFSSSLQAAIDSTSTAKTRIANIMPLFGRR